MLQFQGPHFKQQSPEGNSKGLRNLKQSIKYDQYLCSEKRAVISEERIPGQEQDDS